MAATKINSETYLKYNLQYKVNKYQLYRLMTLRTRQYLYNNGIHIHTKIIRTSFERDN